MPPAPTGVATYARAVVEGLERIGFLERHPLDVLWPVERKHVDAITAYELGVYQLGNNVQHHRNVYRLAWAAPGLVVLHDLALDDFVRGLQSVGDLLGFSAMAEAASGRHRQRDPRSFEDPLDVAWSAAAARLARGIVVHAEFGRRYLEGIGCRTPIFVVPHPPVESDESILRAQVRGRDLRASLAARGVRSLVVAPGDVNRTKLHDEILVACAGLPEDVHVAVVGRPGAGYDVGRLIQRHGLHDRVTVGLDVPDEEFLAWIVAADVVIDLRHPHRGEVSGSLARAMQVGRPTIVSATGTYLEVPEDAVVRVPAGRVQPEVLRAALADLLHDPDRRARIGEAASAHVRTLAATEATARGYEHAILATRDLLRDPIRIVTARWARSLAEIGVDESLLKDGFGVSYARALHSFALTDRGMPPGRVRGAEPYREGL